MDAGGGEFPLNSHNLCFDQNPKPNPLVGSSQGRSDWVPHENTSNGWSSQYDISLPRIADYEYEWPNLCYLGPRPANISKASVLAQNGTASYTSSEASVTSPYGFSNAFGHTDNGMGHYHILQALQCVENGASPCNISEAPSRNWNAVLNILPPSYQSNTAFMKNPMAYFPSMLPVENARNFNDLCEASVLPTGSSLGKRVPYCQSDMNFMNARAFDAFGSNSCYDGGMTQSYLMESSGILSLQQEFENSCRLWPESDQHKGTLFDIFNGERIETKNNMKGEMEEKVDQKTQVGRVERARQFISTDGGAVKTNFSCCPYTTGVDIPGNKVETIGSLNGILETLHYLSGNLLSSDFDDSELKDHGRAILHSAINNLRAFAFKKQKEVTKRSPQDSSLNAAYSPMAGLKSAFDVNQNNAFHNMDEKTRSLGSAISNDEVDFVDNRSPSDDLDNDGNVDQAADKESFQARVYKNLWIDAEAALCALKYELQLAQMKIEVENHNKMKGKSQSSSKSSSQNRNSGDDEDEIPIMAEEKNPIDALPLDKDTGVDASAMARFKVLKDRHDSQNSPTNIDQHLNLTILYDLGVNEPEIKSLALKDDKEIEQSPTDGEPDSCMVKPAFGGEGSSLVFDWEHVEHL